jgi:microcystin-dependent protein
MPLLLAFEPGSLDEKVASAFDDIIAPIQQWAGRIEGINADERLNELASGISGLSTVPTGAGFVWYTSTPPTGYLICDGASVSRVTYANLFTLWGTTFGAGDGGSTFGLPDLRRRFPMGKSASDTLGGTGGTFDHTHTLTGSTDDESSHTHGSGSMTAAADGAHDHGGSTGVGNNENEEGGFFGTGSYLFDTQDEDHTHTISADGGHTHSLSGTTGSGSAHSHGAGTLVTAGSNPPYFVINWIVKT